MMKPKYCDLIEIPKLLKVDSLLVIQPHPDDLEIGAGATVARMIRSGVKVTCLTVTDGSVGSLDHTVKKSELITRRQKETEKAASILGIDDLRWLNFPDGGSLPYEKVRSAITRIIRQLKPAALMVCDPWLPYEVHTDHIRAGLAAAEAGYLAGMPLFCHEDIEIGFEPHTVDCFAFYYTAYPNTFVDVEETWEHKLKAIDCHGSQFSTDQMEMLKFFLTAKAREHAEGKEPDLVECFKVLSSLHLHIFEQAWQC